MRAHLILITTLAVCGAASRASSQEALSPPAAPVGAVAEDVLTWDELPEPIRRRYEPEIGKPSPQAILHVMNAVQQYPDFRIVDHGDVLLEQRIRPAGLARITRSVRNAQKYGPVGAVMWPGVGPDGQYWCWKRPGALNPVLRNNIYCYQDNDGDGTSERLWENPLFQTAPISTHFQFNSLGHDEGITEPASFVVEPDVIGEIEELVVLRYFGVSRGRVQPDGSLVAGIVEFELLTGPDHQTLGVRQRIRVETDLVGKGEYVGRNGIRIMVDGVSLDGTARVRLLGGLPTGRALLFPPLTRDFIVNRMREVLNPDGSQRVMSRDPGEHDSRAAPLEPVG